jgi:hypothetical protein
MTIMDAALFREYGMELSLSLAFENCIKLINKVKSINGVLVFNWHLENPNLNNYTKNMFKLYEMLLDYLQTENAWITTAGKLVDFWGNYTKT